MNEELLKEILKEIKLMRYAMESSIKLASMDIEKTKECVLRIEEAVDVIADKVYESEVIQMDEAAQNTLIRDFLKNERYFIVNDFVQRCKDSGWVLEEPDTFTKIHFLDELIKKLEVQYDIR